jgi:ATP-dependent DNA helicase RecQ
MNYPITSQILHDSLKENFGFEKFRTNQEEIINTILSGHDTLAIMPTGGEINLLSIASSLIFWNYNSNITAYRLDERPSR